MNELIQALGNYTEALEQKITVLEKRISGYEEKVAALEEQLKELAKDSRFYVRPNSSPSETDAPCVAPPTPTDPSAGTQLFLRDSIAAPLTPVGVGCSLLSPATLCGLHRICEGVGCSLPCL